MSGEEELDEKPLEILGYIKAGKEGRRWMDLENEFVGERGWSKGTFVKYWKEAKRFLEKKLDPRRAGRFRYFLREEFEVEPEKAMLKRRLRESEILGEGSIGLPNDLKENYLVALGDAIEENVYRSPFKAWDLLANLMETTPPDFKEKIRPFFVAARKVYDEQWKFRYPSERTRAQAFVKRKIVPFLLDKFSSLLYGDIPQKAKQSEQKG